MIFLIDGKNLLFRTQFAHEKLRDTNGRSTGAIYGFLQCLHMLRRDFREGRFIVCWENGCLLSGKTSTQGTSWRRLLYPEYKGNRTNTGDERYKEALIQVAPIVSLLDLMGVRQVEVPGLEADDLISLFVGGTNDKSVVYSYDSDLFQLLTHEHVILARPSVAKYEFCTTKDVLEKHKVHPRNWTKFRALSGDPSDNIKVLKGVGPVKALSYLKQGLDPSIKQFNQLDPGVQQLFQEIEPLWERLHSAWRISELPQRVEQIPGTSTMQRVSIRALLHYYLTGSIELAPVDVRMHKFLQILSSYDMREFVGKISSFFS